MKLTIDRKTWLRGEGSSDSYLLRGRDGKKCCLGFLASACGLNNEEVEDVSTVAEFVSNKHNYGDDYNIPNQLQFLVDDGGNSADANRLMDLNDMEFTSENDRELGLTNVFRRNGIEVEFV